MGQSIARKNANEVSRVFWWCTSIIKWWFYFDGMQFDIFPKRLTLNLCLTCAKILVPHVFQHGLSLKT